MEEVQIENRDGDRDPLLILGKIEDMMLYAYPVLNAYPKYERFVLAADIKRCMDQEGTGDKTVYPVHGRHYNPGQ